MPWHGLDGGVWRNKCEIPFNEAIRVGRVRRSAGRIQPCEMICGPLPLVFIPLLSYPVVAMIIMYHSSLIIITCINTYIRISHFLILAITLVISTKKTDPEQGHDLRHAASGHDFPLGCFFCADSDG